MMNSIFDLQNYFFNLYALPHFLVGILISIEGFFVFAQSKKSVVSVAYLITTVTAGIWLTGVGFICFSSNEVTALFWSRYYSWFGIIFVTPAVYLFSTAWDDPSLKKQARVVCFNYLTGLIFYMICILSPYLIKGVWHYPQGFFPKAGFLEGPFIIWFYTLVVLSFRNFVRSYRKEKVLIRKKSAKLMIVAFAIAFFGSVEYLSNYGVQFFPVAPLPVFLFVSIMGYCVIRHRLFDLEAIAQAFQREKLATIGLIASSINHEIRNPLYIAKSVLENCLELQKEGIEVKDRNEIDLKALKQIARALDVITKLNRFAKPVEEGPKSETQSASIQEALKNVLDLVSYEFSLDQIQIKNEIPNGLPDIQADPRQLEEILFNLIVNACHAMSRNVSSPKSLVGDPPSDSRQKPSGMTGEYEGILTIRSTIHDARVTLTIADTGCGIAPNQAKHLFEPFHTTKGEKGTGLGLYITKQFVERNGGKISVKSQPNRGTSFILEFSAIV